MGRTGRTQNEERGPDTAVEDTKGEGLQGSTSIGSTREANYFELWASTQRTKHDLTSFSVQIILESAAYITLCAKTSSLPPSFRVEEEKMLVSWHILMLLIYIAAVFLTKQTQFYVKYRQFLLLNARIVNLAILSSFAASSMSIITSDASRAGLVTWWCVFLAIFLQSMFGAPLSVQMQSFVGLLECACMMFKPWERMSVWGRTPVATGLQSWMTGLYPGNLSIVLFHILCVLGLYLLPIQRAYLRDKRLKLSLLGGTAHIERKKLLEALEKKHKTKRQ